MSRSTSFLLVACATGRATASDEEYDEDDITRIAERPGDSTPRYKCEGGNWERYSLAYQQVRKGFYDKTLTGDALEDAKWGFSNFLRVQTNNVTDVLNCNVGVVAGYHLLSRIWLNQEHDWRRAYRLVQLALIFIFTLRNAVRVPRADSLQWGTSAAEVISEIRQLKIKVDNFEYTQRWQGITPVAPDFRDPNLRIALVSICAYPPEFPIALMDVTPKNRDMYGEKHGYEIFTHSTHPMPGSGVHIQHSKLYLIAQYLRSGKYDWVGWFDCDSIIMNMNKTIDSIIYRYAQKPNETRAQYNSKRLSGAWTDSYAPADDPDYLVHIVHRGSELLASAPQIGQATGRIYDMGRKAVLYFESGDVVDAVITWETDNRVTFDFLNGAKWSMTRDDPGLPSCTNLNCGSDVLEIDDEVNLMITEEGWGMSSANWLIKATDWSIQFLESAFGVAHEEIPLFGDQDAMILMLTNFRTLGSWETPEATGDEKWDPVDPQARIIPQREINAYDALNAHFMQCDGWEPGDLLVTFPSCKDPEGCNPFFRTAYQYGLHSLSAPDEDFDRHGTWAHLRVFGPMDVVADIFQEKTEEKRQEKIGEEAQRRYEKNQRRRVSILMEQEAKQAEVEKRRESLSEEELEKVKQEEEERRRKQREADEAEEARRAQEALEREAASREDSHREWEDSQPQEELNVEQEAHRGLLDGMADALNSVLSF